MLINRGKFFFAQVVAHLSPTTFRRSVAGYDCEHKVKLFSCLDPYPCMAFAQLASPVSLPDSEEWHLI